MSQLIIDIKSKIHNIRGKQVLLDSDLAELYGVETKKLNQSVKRNIARFPEDFMFKLSYKEFNALRSQFVTSSYHGGRRHSYFAFTEQGVAMLSGVLRSKKAVEVNIKIMRAFVEMRRFLSHNMVVFEKFQNIDKKLLEHDENFSKIFKEMEKKEMLPAQGIFFDGKVFDAFLFVSDLIKKASTRIVLIDNYVDENVLKLFSDKKSVSVEIYTNNLSDKLVLAVNKFNEQFGNLQIFKFEKNHDRFLIIDNELYHFGASLKDLGKRWFAFSKMNIDLEVVLSRLR